MQANIFHHMYHGLWYSAENSKKLIQKPHFVVGIQKFLDHTFFGCMGDAPVFGQMKGLMKIHNLGKFHGITFVVVKLYIFKCWSKK